MARKMIKLLAAALSYIREPSCQVWQLVPNEVERKREFKEMKGSIVGFEEEDGTQPKNITKEHVLEEDIANDEEEIMVANKEDDKAADEEGIMR
ncbi:hypothetical protein TorRG33x02_194660 [Trema orientale]|uniref:Uncharacterized protein n=1 Tax=Trema orientale TaxID=63057 RepID=A0A2P5EGV7_TREOI|nr:hypothetical protein TorRG33x02_194660 [Trema orientale]